ncbi:phage head closure protein [Massilia sp. BKSP1R2A-1]|uniref:phage head closure protein n=1 Tax=Massilia sp. BKSP1R2A-1 TaxID=3422595 RepID=UPI003D3456DD
MDHKVTLLKPNTARNAANERVGGFVALPDVWANVKFQSGAEVLRAGADVSIVKCSIRIRARRDVTAAWRVRYLGVEYDVKAPLPDSADRDYIYLVCESTA